MHFPLTDAQQKQQIDAEQTYTAWQDAAARAREYAGGMHWKAIAGKEYLYKTLDRKGNAKSLGVLSDATEAIARQFNEHKALAKARLASLTDALATQSKINAALRLGSAPNIVAGLCNRLSDAGLLGSNLMVIGTHSLLAYESMAGVRFNRDIMATSDMDLLWDHKVPVRLAASDELAEPHLLQLLQKVDKSFQVVEKQNFRAANDKGFMVDLIRQMPDPPRCNEPDRFFAEGDQVATDIWNMKWLLNAPRVQQIAIAVNGEMFPICAPDPRAYAMFKLWLAQSDERDPVKKPRDLTQAVALAALITEKLPHLAKNWHQMRSFPAGIAIDAMAKLMPKKRR